jgi:small-conductance mechanosensitive channel
MKDLLENFFYGISLMTGRLRVGDWIECDGIRGKVDSITYQSTSIITDDGSVIAFLNSALFTKNFENLTRNHSYVKSKVKIGVSYGSDIDKIRKILVDNISAMAYKNKNGRDVMDTKKGVNVLLSEFGDSSIELVVVYWTLVSEKIGFDCKVNEMIYNTLNKHHIEIPFPQRDLHIISHPQQAPKNKKGKGVASE